MTPRWEGDERGRGLADASAMAQQVDALAAQMRGGGWVTEDPLEHLEHHLIRACEPPDAQLSLLEVRDDGGVLHVSVRMTEPGTLQDVRGAVMGLVGHVLEGSTFVREDRSGDTFRFEVATGMLPGEGGFSGHGHLLRIVVEDGTP